MDLLPLVISVKRSQFRRDDPTSEHSDKAFLEVKKDILDRDNNTCQFCGLQSSKYQEVHHKNDNHSDNHTDNLVTACTLCHSVFHIGFSGLMGRGALISLNPALDISQSDVNQIVRSLWIAEASKDSDYSRFAQDYLNRLSNAIVNAKKLIGTADPLVLANQLLRLNDNDYINRAEILNGIYFFPYKEKYTEAFNYWLKEEEKVIPTDKWSDIAILSVDKFNNNFYPDIEKSLSRSNFLTSSYEDFKSNLKD